MNLSKEEMPVLLQAIETHHKEISSLNIDKSKLATLEILNDIKSKLLSERIEGTDYGSYHVLIVDNAESAREQLKLLLSTHGFRHMDEADDGHHAIVKIKTKSMPYGKTIPYDLVLIDLNMPTISGLDVLKLMKKDHKYSKIPFIMITSDKNKENLIEAMKAGVHDYITKPLDEVNLMLRINKLLQ
mgnify:CR=1 FL=1|jgi:two-component system, chemotaxis family, chemotaxis protein CheY